MHTKRIDRQTELTEQLTPQIYKRFARFISRSISYYNATISSNKNVKFSDIIYDMLDHIHKLNSELCIAETDTLFSLVDYTEREEFYNIILSTVMTVKEISKLKNVEISSRAIYFIKFLYKRIAVQLWNVKDDMTKYIKQQSKRKLRNILNEGIVKALNETYKKYIFDQSFFDDTKMKKSSKEKVLKPTKKSSKKSSNKTISKKVSNKTKSKKSIDDELINDITSDNSDYERANPKKKSNIKKTKKIESDEESINSEQEEDDEENEEEDDDEEEDFEKVEEEDEEEEDEEEEDDEEEEEEEEEDEEDEEEDE
jgi:hypothetical protein